MLLNVPGYPPAGLTTCSDYRSEDLRGVNSTFRRALAATLVVMLVREIRYSARQLWRTPAFTLAAIL
jgi:hypothetical protein